MVDAPIRALLRLAAPLRRMRRRNGLVERLLSLDLDEAGAAAVARACAAGQRPFGAFYHWRLRQWATVSCAGRMPAPRLRRWFAAIDRTPLARWRAFDGGGRGMLVATPHYGAFLPGIVSLAHHASAAGRQVLVFYDPPGRHDSNAVFDAIHSKLWPTADSGVRIVHNTRAGIGEVLRALRLGALVVIMPDVFERVEDTFLVPFHGGLRNVVLGTATLARKSGAVIVPMVAQPLAQGFDFELRAGPAIDAGALRAPALPDETPPALYTDYVATAQLFASIESLMGGDLLYWQYHASLGGGADAPLRTLPPLADAEVAALLGDPALQPSRSPACFLDEEDIDLMEATPCSTA